MKKHLLTIPLLLICALSASCQKKLQTIKISQINPYCGGAAPTPEMEAEARKARPYKNQTVVLVSETGKVDSAKTNDAGIIKIKLSRGNYKLYESWRYYKLTPAGNNISAFNKDCLENEWQKYFMSVTVSKKTTIQSSDGPIQIPCQWNLPCLNEVHLPPTRPQK
jgi:hypothetical protein